jgi:hypothetical protein
MPGMKKANSIIVGMAVVLTLAGAAYALRFRYDHVPSGNHTILVRTNRFTDTVEVLEPGRWVNKEAEAKALGSAPPNPHATAAECQAQALNPNPYMDNVLDFSKCPSPLPAR